MIYLQIGDNKLVSLPFDDVAKIDHGIDTEATVLCNGVHIDVVKKAPKTLTGTLVVIVDSETTQAVLEFARGCLDGSLIGRACTVAGFVEMKGKFLATVDVTIGTYNGVQMPTVYDINYKVVEVI